MKKVFSIFLLLILIGFVPVSFTDCSPCKCTGPDTQTASIQSITIGAYCINRFMDPDDTITFYPYDSIRGYISANDFKILSYTKLSTPNGFSFTQSAYAYRVKCDIDCPAPLTTTTNFISVVKFISQTDTIYNDTLVLKRGDLLNDIVGVKKDSSIFSIKDFLSVYKMPTYDNRWIELVIKTRPSHPINLVFDVKIQLNDSSVFNFNNKQLKIR